MLIFKRFFNRRDAKDAERRGGKRPNVKPFGGVTGNRSVIRAGPRACTLI